ncbi:MAG: NYN domain-containing protein [Lactobacillales bacterium]|jgi:predicted RNA-binding protein with PIN domain|nr:NYN domain-containing protein [Lactobacillales bacterium]
MKKQLLIVDGYNMIGSWPNLVALKKQDKLEDARELLLHELSNYAKFEDIEVMVVFDAMYVPGITKSFEKYQLTVVFTSEGETADSYIERMAGERNTIVTQVTVATSDLAEQWVVFSQGALRKSARELYKNVERSKNNVSTFQEDLKFQNYRRNSPWNSEQLLELERKMEELQKKPK